MYCVNLLNLKELYVRLRTDPSPYSKVFIVKGKGVTPASRQICHRVSWGVSVFVCLSFCPVSGGFCAAWFCLVHCVFSSCFFFWSLFAWLAKFHFLFPKTVSVCPRTSSRRFLFAH